MTGILGLALPTGIVPILIGGAALLAVGVVGGGIGVHKIDGISLSKSQAQTAQARADLSAYGASVAADTAKANQLALSQQIALQDRLNALQSQLAQTQKAENEKSSQLQALLQASKPGDSRLLGPTSLAYFDRLRSPSPTPSPANH